MSCTPTLSQDAYRLRNDNGNETTATWLYNENVSGTVAYDTNFRIRFVAQVTNACAATNRIFQLQYSLNGGTWTNVDASSAVVRSSASPNLADAANLTDQMTTGSGTFIGTTGFDEVDGAAGGNSLDIAASGQAQVEYCVQIRSVDVGSGGSVQLRIVDSQANLATWNQTPTLPLAPITIPLSSDPWANLDDTTPTIDKQDLGATPITPPEQIDAMPAYGERLGLALSYSGDSMTMADATPTVERRRLGWLDTLTFDKQVVSETDITRNLSADAMPAYGERVGLGLEFKGDAFPAYVDSLAGEWTYPGWIDSITVLREDVGLVAISRNVPEDAWATLADTTPIIKEIGILRAQPAADPNTAYGERLGLGIGLRGDTMPLADTTPVIDERGILRVNVAADPWGNLADATPIIDKRGILTANLAADPMPAYAERVGLGIGLLGDSLPFADQTPIFDLKSAAITKDIPADPWGNLADTTPTYSEFGFLTAAPSPDANIAYAERLGLGIELRGDSLPLADTTPTYSEFGYLTAQPAADPNAAYTERLGLGIALLGDGMVFGDTTPNVDLKGAAISKNVPEDAWGTLADATPTYSEFGYLTAQPAADPNIAYAEKFGLGVGLLGDAMVMADQTPVVDKQTVAATPITANIPDDAWGNLGDTTPIYSEFGFLTAQPAADPNAAYAERVGLGIGLLGDSMAFGDQTPTVEVKTASITENIPADNLNLWADSADASTSGSVPKNFNLPADDFANYAERLGLGEGLRDPWANLADQTPIVVKIGILKANVTADPWANLADTTPTVAKTTLKTAAPSADPNVAYGERLGTGRGFTDGLANYAERLGLGIRLTDNLTYEDSIQVNAGGAYQFTLTDSTLQNWADTPPDQNYGKLYAVPTDAMSMGDTTPAYTYGKIYGLTDAFEAYVDALDPSLALGLNLADIAAPYFDDVAATKFGYLLYELIDANADYADAINLLIVGFDWLVVQITESMANWDDSADSLEKFYALHLQGRSTEQVSLNGKTQTQVNLGGKSGEELEIAGKVFDGTL